MKYEILGMPGEHQLGRETHTDITSALIDAIEYMGTVPLSIEKHNKVGVFGYDAELHWIVEDAPSLKREAEYAVIVRKPYRH